VPDCGVPDVVFWIFTKTHRHNFLVQIILVIAYFHVVKRCLKTRQNTEPFIIWIGMLIAPFYRCYRAKECWPQCILSGPFSALVAAPADALGEITGNKRKSQPFPNQ
jgi:hypothetical protein